MLKLSFRTSAMNTVLSFPTVLKGSRCCSPCRTPELSAHLCLPPRTEFRSLWPIAGPAVQHHCSVGRSYGGTARWERDHSEERYSTRVTALGEYSPPSPTESPRVIAITSFRGGECFVTLWLVKHWGFSGSRCQEASWNIISTDVLM